MILAGPKRDYTLVLNLHLVERMEKEGCLLTLADRLTAGIAKQEEVFSRLKTVYQAAGCLLPSETLRRFLQEKNQESILAEILLNILSPLLSMGAVFMGEP